MAAAHNLLEMLIEVFLSLKNKIPTTHNLLKSGFGCDFVRLLLSNRRNLLTFINILFFSLWESYKLQYFEFVYTPYGNKIAAPQKPAFSL